MLEAVVLAGVDLFPAFRCWAARCSAASRRSGQRDIAKRRLACSRPIVQYHAAITAAATVFTRPLANAVCRQQNAAVEVSITFTSALGQRLRHPYGIAHAGTTPLSGRPNAAPTSGHTHRNIGSPNRRTAGRQMAIEIGPVRPETAGSRPPQLRAVLACPALYEYPAGAWCWK